MRTLLAEIRIAQTRLDEAIEIAKALPETEPAKHIRIARYNALKREIDTTVKRLSSKFNQWILKEVPRTYTQGWMVGATTLNVGYDFNILHQQAIEVLQQDAFDDVATRLQTVSDGFATAVDSQRAMANLRGQELIRIGAKSGITQQVLTGLDDPGDVARALRDKLFAEQVQITDAGGRRWGLETYSRMLVRTKSAVAYNSGSLNKYAEEGVYRVRVFDGVLDDLECANANGQVWTLRYASEHVIGHPNCRRAFGPVVGVGAVNRVSDSERAQIRRQITRAAAPQLAVMGGLAIGLFLVAKHPELVARTMQKSLVKFNDFGLPDKIQEIQRTLGLLTRKQIQEFLEYVEEQKVIVSSATSRTIAFYEDALGNLDRFLRDPNVRVGVEDSNAAISSLTRFVNDPEFRKQVEVDLGARTRSEVATPAEFRLIHDRLVSATEETATDAIDIDFFFPSRPGPEVPPLAASYVRSEQLDDMQAKLTAAGALAGDPDGFSTSLHKQMTEFFGDMANPRLAVDDELEEVARLLSHPDDDLKTAWDFIQETGTKPSLFFAEIWSALRNTADSQLSSPPRIEGRQLSAFFRRVDWQEVSNETPLWEDAGLPVKVSDSWVKQLEARWVEPLEQGIDWLTVEQGLTRTTAETILRRTFGDANVDIGPAGINGLTFFITDPDTGLKWFLKWNDGRLTGRIGAVLGERWTDDIAQEIGSPRTPFRVVHASDDVGMWMLMPELEGIVGTASDVPADLVRQIGLLDLLTNQVDGHQLQYMQRRITPSQAVLHFFDREMTFDVNVLQMLLVSPLERHLIKSSYRSMPNQMTAARLVDWYDFQNANSPNPVSKFSRLGVTPSAEPFDRPWVAPIELTGRPLLPIPTHAAEGRQWVLPGQLIDVEGEPFPVFYLTNTEADLIEQLLRPSSALKDRMIGNLLDDLNTISPSFQFEEFSKPRTAAELEDLAEFVFNRFQDRIRFLLDEGALVLPEMPARINDFNGNVIRLGSFQTFDIANPHPDKLGGRSQITGPVIHQWLDSQDSYRINVIVDWGTDQAQVVTLTENSVLPRKSPLLTKEIELESDLLDFQVPQSMSYFPNTNNQWLEQANNRLTYDHIYNEIGVFESYEPHRLGIDVSALNDGIILPNGDILPGVEVTNRVRNLIIEELANVNPHHRPSNIVIVDGFIDVEGQKKLARFSTGNRTIEISSLLLQGADFKKTGVDRLRHVLRHELVHSALEREQAIGRAKLSHTLLREFVEDVMEPGATYEDAVVKAATLIPPERIPSDQNALEALISNRARVVSVANLNRRAGMVAEILELTADDPPEWTRAARTILESDISGVGLKGSKEAHLVQEFLAEGMVAAKEARGSGALFPPGIPDEARSYWTSLVDDTVWDEFAGGGLNLPAAGTQWGITELKDINTDFFIKLPPLGFNPTDIVNRVLRVAPEDGGGGATVRVISGREPTKGFVVALREREKIVSPEDFNEQVIVDYIEKNIDLLGDEDLGWTFGVWWDRDTNEIFLDVSRVERYELDAIRFGINEKQKAVFNLSTFDEIRLETKNKKRLYKHLNNYILEHRVREVADDTRFLAPLTSKTDPVTPFTKPDGTPAPLRLKYLPKEVKKKILEGVRNKWLRGDEPMEITEELFRTNYERILRVAEQLYRENPNLRVEHRFYVTWNSLIGEATDQANIPFDRGIAASASMSPNLDAETNIFLARQMIAFFGENRTIESGKRLRGTQKRMNDILKQRARDGKKKRTLYERDLTELQFIRELVAHRLEDSGKAGYRQKLHTGMSIKDMTPEVAMQAFRVWVPRDTGVLVATPAGYDPFHKAIRILKGESDISEVLTGPKVRPFNNNLLDPKDVLGRGDSTIDYHMLDAGMFLRGSIKKFAQLGTPSNSGVELGVRAVAAEALSFLFEETDWAARIGADSVAEMQEVIWAVWKYGLEKDRNLWGDLPGITLRS